MIRKRVTQQDVARRAGLTRATVSMALHHHPSIPAATQKRIRKIAEEMGYTPDPMLSALASYRNTLRPQTFHGTLAWLGNNVPPYNWKSICIFEEYYQGALKRAAAHGYNLELFDLHARGTTPEKLARTFRFRNINGVILSPQPGPNWELQFPWDDFSFITFGYSLVKPSLHTVAPMQFRAMMTTMRMLYSLGYRRIGFACSFVTDERTDHHLLGGYLVEKFLFEHTFSIPPFDEENATSKQFLKWFRRYRPEAVVTGNPRLIEVIEGAGLKVPRDIGVATPTRPNAAHRIAGVYEDSVHMGEVAVDMLVGMINRGERGIPAQPHYIHVPGIWKQGDTVLDLTTRTSNAPRGKR